MQPTLTRRAALKGAAAFTGALAGPALSRAASRGDWIIRGSIPLTGPFAATGVDGLKTTQDWVGMRNASGGIAGRRIDLAYEDSGYDPKTSLHNFRRAMRAERPPHFYFGDSTGFMRLVRPELARTPVLNGGASFASELARPHESPWQFVTGPTYGAMAEIAMRYIAASGGARVAIVHSDTEYGREPLARAYEAAADLGMEIVLAEPTKLKNADAKAHVAALMRADPDHVFVHGYIANVWPEIIAEARALGMDARFVGTFWSMDPVAARLAQTRFGDVLDGYAGVMPYRYFHEAEQGPAYREFAAFRKAKHGADFDGEISAWSLQGLATLALLEKIFTDVASAGAAPTPHALVDALERVRNWDSGGYFGPPATVEGHSIRQARICRYNASKRLFEPVTKTIHL